MRGDNSGGRNRKATRRTNDRKVRPTGGTRGREPGWAALEQLEQRTLLAVWDGGMDENNPLAPPGYINPGTGTLWSNPLNWAGDAGPGGGATIGPTGPLSNITTPIVVDVTASVQSINSSRRVVVGSGVYFRAEGAADFEDGLWVGGTGGQFEALGGVMVDGDSSISGALDLHGGITLRSGATLQVVGTVNAITGGDFDGDVTLASSGAVLNLGGESLFRGGLTLNATNCSLIVTGTAVIEPVRDLQNVQEPFVPGTGVLAWNAGVMEGPGTVELRGPASLRVGAAGTKSLRCELRGVGRQYVIQLQNQVIGPVVEHLGSSLAVISLEGGTFRAGQHTFMINVAESTGTLEFRGVAGSNLLEVVDGASLSKTGSGRLLAANGSANMPAAINGRLDILEGTVELGSGSPIGAGSQGTIELAFGTNLLLGGSHTFATDAQILAQQGVIRVKNGATTFNGPVEVGRIYFDGGTTNVNGTLVAFVGADLIGTSAALNVNGTASLGNTIFSAGTLGGAGVTTIAGAMSWTAGTMSGLGSTVVTGSLGLTGSGSRSLRRTLDIVGTFTWNHTGAGTVFLEMVGGTLINRGTLTIDPTLTSGIVELRATGGTNVVRNERTLNKQGPGSLLLTTTGGTFGVTNTATGSLALRAGKLTAGVGVPLTNTGGSVAVDAGTLKLDGGGSNDGVIRLRGGALDLTASLASNGVGAMVGAGGTTVSLSTNLGGTTSAAHVYRLLGKTTFTGATTRTLEVMGRDLGAVGAGFDKNFAYAHLALANGVTLRLNDGADNAPGAGAEAVYVNRLDVPLGTTLNLNGLHLYTRSRVVAGSVINGTITVVPDGGQLVFTMPTSGQIAAVGQVDEWTFYARAGDAFGLRVEGAVANITPALNWTQVDVLAPDNTVLASASNVATGSGSAFELLGITVPVEGTYRVRIKAPGAQPSATGWYTINAWGSTRHEFPLVLGDRVTGMIEGPYAEDHWVFSGRAGQQVRQFRLAADSSSLVLSLTGPNGFVGFTDLAAHSGLINLPEDGEYRLVARGLAQATGAYTFRLEDSSVTDLTLGTPYAGALPGPNSVQLFRVVMPEGKALTVTFDSADATVEMYARYGAPPTRLEHDHRSSAVGPDHSVLVAPAYGGEWYVLVYGARSTPGQAFSIRADVRELVLTKATPDVYGTDNTARLTLRGAGFRPGMTVHLEGTGISVPGTNLAIDSSSQLTLDIDLNGVPQGEYTLVARLPTSETESLPFRVAAGDAKLEASLVVPGALGRHALATLYVEYANVGYSAMPAPLLIVQSADPEGDEYPMLTLNGALLRPGVSVNVATDTMPAGFDASIQILASGEVPGVLNPGERMRVPVHYAGLRLPWTGDTKVDLALFMIDETNQDPIPWSEIRDVLRPPGVPADAWLPVFDTLVHDVGDTKGTYVRALANSATYLGRLGRPILDVQTLWSFQLQQAIGVAPPRQLALTIDTTVPTTGLSLELMRMYSDPIPSRYRTGPWGRGWTTPWQTLALTDPASGAVDVTGPTGTIRRFSPDLRSTVGSNPLTATRFSAQPGDTGVLTRASPSGVLALKERDGTTIVFLPASGALDYLQDPSGNRITADYDTLGRLARLTHTGGEFITLTYNAAGLIAQAADSIGRTTSYAYDSSNEHLLEVDPSAGPTIRYTYFVASDPFREHALLSIDTAGTIKRFGYDAYGRLASIAVDGDTGRRDFHYGPGGQVTSTDALGASTAFFYDDRGLLLKAVDPLGNATRSVYDPQGRLVRNVFPDGAFEAFAWSAQGDLTHHVDALGHTTQFEHAHPLGVLTSLIDARGNVTRYTYDAAGRVFSTVYPDGSRSAYTYDGLGRVVTTTNRRGQTIHYTYNSAGQITQQTLPNGTMTALGYDLHGNLTSVTDTRGTTVYEYNADDRLARVAYPDGRYLAMSYDALGRRTQLQDHTGRTVVYEYGTNGQLGSVRTDGSQYWVEYTYDAGARLTQRVNGNGTYATMAYDLAGRVTELVNYAQGGAITSLFAYAYDARGRRVQMTTSEGEWNYAYDVTGQLTDAVLTAVGGSGTPSMSLHYDYDAVGNRLRRSVDGAQTVYVTNELNQYTQIGTAVLGYDLDGNLIRREGPEGAESYAYDAQNRLVGASTGSGAWTYDYDAFGQRVGAADGAMRWEFLVDPIAYGDVVGAYEAGGASEAYVYGVGLVGTSGIATARTYYDVDALGSVVGVSDANGSGIGRTMYGPFGEVIHQAGQAPTRFGFLGQWGVESEPTGLTSMRGRAYKSGDGMWLSEDPRGLGAGDINTRRYAFNAPVDLVDVSGRACVAYRQLESSPWLLRSEAMDTANQEVMHEHIFYENGRNIGYEKHGLFTEKSAWQYTITGECYDDAVMDKAVDIVTATGEWTAENYRLSLFHHNCQDFVEAVRREMRRMGQGPRPYDWLDLWLPPGSEIELVAWSIVGAVDPNHLLGPGGYGIPNYVAGDSVLPYRIEFENYGPGTIEASGSPAPAERWATAPAQRIELTSTLEPDLDLSTFRLTGFGFGDVFEVAPDGTQNHDAIVNITIDGVSFEVWFESRIDFATRTLRFVFQSMDPGTGLPPEVMVGLLPPEDGTGRGKGFVTYTIDPVAGLPTGTEIRNIALIRFDVNDVIATNQIDPLAPQLGTDPEKEALVTIDAGNPTSMVDPLPPTVNAAAFTVRWSGADDAGGAGIESYTVYVSDNGTDYVPWLLHTALTEAEFIGEDGHTYAFFSVARDHVGNVEADPASADTTTQVVLDTAAPTSSVDPLPPYTNSGSFLVRWSGQDGPGGSGLASFTIYVSVDGGAFTPWLTDTVLTEAQYNGLDGHTYAFYSVARDNEDNVEAAPAAADATTTVDTTAATSAVEPLPPYTNTGSFLVRWSGQDPPTNGSGLASFTIYVSVDGGAFQLWLTDTTLTEAQYDGADGHTYAFYSVARDHANNVEAAPAQADATTTVDTSAATSAVEPLPPYTNTGSFLVRWSGQDSGSGLVSFTVYVSIDGGTFIPWLSDTTLTEAQYNGSDGHTYAFYSIARDNADNIEAAPAAADATTTVDTTSATSAVDPLPQYTTTPSFLVRWSGQDPPTNGSGLASFTIYVSIDGGAFQPWLTDTTLTEAQYAGQDGHTYAFYSIARDHAGNVEAASAQPDATTLVDAAAATSAVDPLPQYTTTPSFLVRWSGQDATSGLASFTIYVSIDGGAFTPWLSDTTLTEAQYNGSDGHTYAFYSVARDQAGNIEVGPAAADATTLVDATGPASEVEPLPGITTSVSFTVRWSGQDAANGSGLATFTIYVAVDGGAFQPWLTDTTLTEAIYNGSDGHSYAFYSVARDHAGNAENAPGSPDAATLVQTQVPGSGPVVQTVDVGMDLRTVIIQLNDQDLNAASATDLANYRILVANGDANNDGNFFNDGDETYLTITSVEYNAATDRIILHTQEGIFNDLYRVVIDGDDASGDGASGVRDTAGRFLDGGDHTATFDLRSLSLVQSLLNQVEALGLPTGPTNSLMAKLDAVVTLLGVNPNGNGVIAKLNAFITGVNHWYNSGYFSSQIRDSLIAQAQFIITGLTLYP